MRPSRLQTRLSPTATLLAGLVLPAGVGAQAVCSAPHSSPGVTPSGSLAVLEPGAGWVQGSLRGQRSLRFFGTQGTVHRLPGGAEATTVSAYLTGAVGLTWGLELWAQLPVHRLALVEADQTRDRVGLGDARVSLRMGSELFGLNPLPVSARFGVKVPGSAFPVDSRVLPLSEGQTDLEVAVESGRALGTAGMYAVGWAGYRWRAQDEATDRKPGDEWFGHLAVGGSAGRWRLQLGLEALVGRTPVDHGVSIPASARRLIQLSPTVGWDTGPGRVEVSAQIPVSGRNLPTGRALGVGYLLTFGGS